MDHVPQFFDTIGILYNESNMYATQTCSGFMMGADTGNGSLLYGVLTPGERYDVVTARFGSQGSPGDRYYLYIYTGTTLGNISLTTVSLSTTALAREPVLATTSYQSCEGTRIDSFICLDCGTGTSKIGVYIGVAIAIVVLVAGVAVILVIIRKVRVVIAN